jgi:putative phosphoesterase
MKIAVLADIHGNFPALEAVTDHIERWKPDLVLVAGDIVNRGPRSQDCFWFLQGKQRDFGWEIIRGNHEDYVISRDDPKDPKSGRKYELFQPAHFIYQQFNQDISALESLPEVISKTTPEQGEIRMVHASMRDNRDGIYPETEEHELREQIAPPPAVFITGHTHRPLVQTLDRTLIVNAGSVGLPFDGDKRAGYAQITWHRGHWSAEIVRLDYDIAQAEADFYETGYIEGAGPIAGIVLWELKLALSQLYNWSASYSQLILEGKITVTESVVDYLAKPITKPYW